MSVNDQGRGGETVSVMFSYFKNGIFDTKGASKMQLCQLVQLNKINPQIELINKVRALRREGNKKECQKEKRGLSNITPACIVRERSIKGLNFSKNFIVDSGFVYIDFDFEDIKNVLEHKSRFIEKYGHIIAYCAVSSSMGGFSVLVRHAINIISPEHYTDIWNYLTSNVFSDFVADEMSKDFGRAMYISYDPDVYVNYENIVDLSHVHVTPYVFIEQLNTHSKSKGIEIQKKKRNENTSISKVTDESIVELHIPHYTYGIRYKTETVCNNPIIDIEKREYIELYFNKNIKDTKKHKTYKKLILAFLRLNPIATKDDLVLYMTNLNKTQEHSMGSRRLMELINYNWNLFHSPDFEYDLKYKGIHINPDSDLSRHQRNCISNKVNGKLKQNDSISKIQEAKEQLASENKKVNIANVIKVTQLSRGTVTKLFNAELNDISELSRQINEGEVIYPYVPDETDTPKRKRRKKDSPQGEQ